MDPVQICSEVFLEVASFITCKPQPQLVRSHVEAGNRELIVRMWIQQSHSFSVSGVSHIMSGLWVAIPEVLQTKVGFIRAINVWVSGFLPHSIRHCYGVNQTNTRLAGAPPIMTGALPRTFPAWSWTWGVGPYSLTKLCSNSTSWMLGHL